VHSVVDALNFAIRAARADTERHRVVTFEGTWHSRVTAAEEGLQATGHRTDHRQRGPGFVLPIGDTAAVERVFADHGGDVAAVVVEPYLPECALDRPSDEFLAGLRSVCDAHNALLVYDETVSGLRVAPTGPAGGAPVYPDFTLLGPIIGGGLPLAACAGRKDAFQGLSSGEGARSGSPDDERSSESVLALAAGIATLQAIAEDGFYDQLESQSLRLDQGLRLASATAGAAVRHWRVGSVLGIQFENEGETTDGAEPVGISNNGAHPAERFVRFHQAMLDRGVLLAPSPAGRVFVSAAHTDGDLDRAVEAAHASLQTIAG
jgi:glutamate-1-semialdehyde 2,1-aminomutase